MTMKKFIYCIFFVISAIGCHKSSPSGLPPLVPYTIKVVDNQQPITGVDIGLYREEGQGGWSLGGITNSDGIAKIQTIFGSFEGYGIPAGTYRVLFNKRIELPQELILSEEQSLKLSPEELTKWDQKKQKYIKEHRILPDAFSDWETTPIKITVSETEHSFTVDVSKYH
jgi:hypothetical protein